jgi:hypothetical protein
VLAHKHELMALQSAVVVANRGGILSSAVGKGIYNSLRYLHLKAALE